MRRLQFVYLDLCICLTLAIRREVEKSCYLVIITRCVGFINYLLNTACVFSKYLFCPNYDKARGAISVVRDADGVIDTISTCGAGGPGSNPGQSWKSIYVIFCNYYRRILYKYIILFLTTFINNVNYNGANFFTYFFLARSRATTI